MPAQTRRRGGGLVGFFRSMAVAALIIFVIYSIYKEGFADGLWSVGETLWGIFLWIASGVAQLIDKILGRVAG